MCEHLEVSGFTTYSILTESGVERVMLQRCMSCQSYLTLDSRRVQADLILGETRGTITHLRTVTAQINSELYEELQNLVRDESGTRDAGKIMSEVVSLGIEQYRKTLSPRLQ